LLESHVAFDPFQMLLGPSLHPLRPAAAAEKKLAHSVARFELILLRRLTSSHQTAQCLMRFIRHSYRGQFPGR
jgi:hypothetical protein